MFSVYFLNLYIEGYVYDVFIRVFFGIVSTLLTNAISIAVLYVMIRHQSLQIYKSYKYIMIGITLWGLLCGIPISLAVTKGQDRTLTDWSYLYQATRFGSILLNILMYIYIQIIVIRRGYAKSPLSNDLYSGQANNNAYRPADPVVILSNRMKYYPVIQVITRVCVSYHELKYGYGYDYTASSSPYYKSSCILYALTLPSAAIGYFIVFLTVTPGAWSHFLNGWRRLFGLEIDNTFENNKIESLNRYKSRSRSRGEGLSSNISDSVLSKSILADDATDSDNETGYPERLSNQSRESSTYTDTSSYSHKYNFDYCDEDELSCAIVDLYGSTNSSDGRAYSIGSRIEENKGLADSPQQTFYNRKPMNTSDRDSPTPSTGISKNNSQDGAACI